MNKIKELTAHLRAFIGKAQYENEGQQIVNADNHQLLLDVRGWGAIQNLFADKKGNISLSDATKFQDEFAQFVTDAINTALNQIDIASEANNGNAETMNSEQLKQRIIDYASSIVIDQEILESGHVDEIERKMFHDLAESCYNEYFGNNSNNAESMAVDDDAIKAMAEKESIISYPLYKEDSIGTVEHINEKRRLYATAYIKGAKDMLKIKGSPDGWIKINSEKDLPSRLCYCWLRIPNDMFVALYVPHKQCFVDNDGEYYDDVITHYKPITKPQPPKNK